MSNRREHIGDDILVLYLTGDANSEQRLFVEEWLNDNENQVYFQKLKDTWELTNTTYPPQDVDTESAWDNLNKKIVSENKDTLNEKTKSKFFFLKIAAAILIPLALISLFKILNHNNAKQNLQTIASNDSIVSKTLIDGSLISLNSESEISFDESFSGETRLVELKGEAFFEVKRDENKPFIINTSLGGIQVLGTSFKVNAQPNSDMLVAVESGLVKLYHVENRDTSFILLKAGESGILKRNTFELVHLSESKPDALFWLNKKLSFKNTPLNKVFETLAHNYKVEFDFDNTITEKCKLTAEFENDEIDTILNVISTTFGFTMKKQNAQTIWVRGNKTDCLDAQI